ncbi:MAG: cobalamin-dependent protein [Deltaproteobacteria bacterium]|nr:cobalamin-dependent protein [Deltaproteobacteria bacterium]
MDDAKSAFRAAVGTLASQWMETGLPSRQGLDEAAGNLEELRSRLHVNGLWEDPPSMVTATLDDGLGQGLAVIEKFAGAAGIRLISLGLMQPPEAIIDACRRHQPDLLGLTILQFDTEDDLIRIANHLPRKTRIVAGGPVFAGDPDFAGRTGTHFAAKNVAYFLRYLLDMP